MDDGIQRAFRIGEANAKIIELARNWCANLQVQQAGGVGIVEMQTGLPIGMRSFRCIHASAAGFAGMDLRRIALDFYDRNCKGCDKRIPVAMPNLLTALVHERDEAAEKSRHAREAKEREQRAAYKSRKERRDRLSENCDEPTSAIFSALDSFDSEPSREKGEVLKQLASVAPERFRGPLETALFSLGNETTSYMVAEVVLEVLRKLGADSDALCTTALGVLSRATLSIAGTIVAEHIGEVHKSDVLGAVPSLIDLAGPHEHHFFGAEVEDHAEGLLAAFRIAPDSVRNIIKGALKNESKIARIRAAHAIQLVRQVDPVFGIELIPDLVKSTELPDDHYEIGSAESWVQDVLAEMLENNFDEVDRLLSESFGSLNDHDDDVGLDKVYLRLFRSRRHRDEERTEVTHAHEVIFGRLIQYLSTDCQEQRSMQLLDFLRHYAKHFPTLVEQHIDGLLGAIAVIAEQKSQSTISPLQLDLPKDPLALMEAESRQQALYYLMDAIAQVVGETSASLPTTVGRALLSTIARVEDTHDQLRASLVKALGLMADNRETLPEVLPALYGAMTGRSQLVRSAAARAFGEVIRKDPDDLPPLLHETFLTLLSDPFVIVHSAALHVLDRNDLPDSYGPRLLVLVLNALEAHSGAQGNKDVLKVALEVLLRLLSNSNSSMSEKARDFVLEKITRLSRYDASRMLTRQSSRLTGRPGFVPAVLSILHHGESEHEVEDLMNALYEAPAENIRVSADAFVDTMSECSDNGNYVVDSAIEILTASSLWKHALKLAEKEEKRWADTQWDRPMKLRSRLRKLYCALEHSCSIGDVDEVRECIAAIRGVQKEIAEDDAKNAARRDPLFGLADQD
jgi:hypothetical protein